MLDQFTVEDPTEDLKMLEEYEDDDSDFEVMDDDAVAGPSNGTDTTDSDSD